MQRAAGRSATGCIMSGNGLHSVAWFGGGAASELDGLDGRHVEMGGIAVLDGLRYLCL
jgi:hypothetical protein